MRGIGSVPSGLSVALQECIHGAPCRFLFRIQPGSKVEDLGKDHFFHMPWSAWMLSFLSHATGHHES